jgi:hypothetical protein
MESEVQGPVHRLSTEYTNQSIVLLAILRPSLWILDRREVVVQAGSRTYLMS